MENKEIKNTAVELNDDVMEDVSGGCDVIQSKPVFLNEDGTYNELITMNNRLDELVKQQRLDKLNQ